MAHGEDQPTISIPLQKKIERCPKIQTSIWWPAPVDLRLDDLLDRARQEGGQMSRSQLLAALVASAEADGSIIRDLVTDYRKMTAGSVVKRGTGNIEMPKRQRGPRPQPD